MRGVSKHGRDSALHSSVVDVFGVVEKLRSWAFQRQQNRRKRSYVRLIRVHVLIHVSFNGILIQRGQRTLELWVLTHWRPNVCFHCIQN